MTFKAQTRRLLAAAALTLLMTLALAACGGDGDEASSESSSAIPSEELIDERSTTNPVVAPEGDELLLEEKVIMESALAVDLTHSSVFLPLRGSFEGETVWYVITESSDSGLANDLDVNFSSKLSNMGIGCPKCVQEVTMRAEPGTPFGEAVVEFQGIPDFKPDRRLVPGTGELAFPPAEAVPGALGGRDYSPFIRIRVRPRSTTPRSSRLATAPSTSRLTPTRPTACCRSRHQRLRLRRRRDSSCRGTWSCCSCRESSPGRRSSI